MKSEHFHSKTMDDSAESQTLPNFKSELPIQDQFASVELFTLIRADNKEFDGLLNIVYLIGQSAY